MNVLKKHFLLVILFFSIQLSHSQVTSTISGYAPQYVGEQIEIFFISDYLTKYEISQGKTEVQADSTFSLTIYNDITRKSTIHIGKNHFQLYLTPDGNYDIFIENSPTNNQKHPEGFETSFFFLDLDTNDINYKILKFEGEVLSFLSKNYNRRAKDSGEFAVKLEKFKEDNTEKLQNEQDEFFQIYVKFAIANLDDLPFKGNRNRYEKYDFYIKPETVWYENDRYMEYILSYYNKYAEQMPRPLNQKIYEAIIASSPTLMINALGKDYALENVKLREFIMLKILSDSYHSNEYPQTNIISILDSISQKSLFQQNNEIAKQLKQRLTALSPGVKMPFYNIKSIDKQISNVNFKGKHYYIHFVKADQKLSANDLNLLKALYIKYNDAIEFFTIVIDADPTNFDLTSFTKKQGISWPIGVISTQDLLLDKAQVKTYPSYLLVDASDYVIASPALSPRPNNEYETIEKLLFNIQKIKRKEEEKR